jgi:tRNA1Val (adenine37-N6)-methyltransferase
VLELPRGRYRTNADSLLLADFCPRVRGTVFDLGAGVGAIGLAIAASSPHATIVLVERDPEAVEIAKRNAKGLARVSVLEGDVRTIANAHRGEAALVVCNPPYVPEGRGRAPRAGKRDAKMGDPDSFVVSARALLGRRGSACFVYPTTNLLDFLVAMRKRGLEPKRIQLVHVSETKPARIALIEAKAAKRGGLVIEPAILRP